MTDIIDPPARSRTATLGYQFPPSRPTTVPPAHECVREHFLDLAAGAAQHADQMWALVGSPDYVAGICRDYSECMEYELRTAQADLRTAQAELQDARTRAANLERSATDWATLYAAELGEAVRLRELHAAVSAENAALRRQLAEALTGQRIQAGFERLTITVTGESYEAVASRLTAAVRSSRVGACCVDDLFDHSEAIDADSTEVIR